MNTEMGRILQHVLYVRVILCSLIWFNYMIFWICGAQVPQEWECQVAECWGLQTDNSLTCWLAFGKCAFEHIN